MPTYTGHVVLTHGSDDAFHMYVTDGNGARILEVRVADEEASKLFHTAHTPCSYVLVFPELAGLTAERKVVVVKKPRIGSSDDERRELLKVYEVDGWRGSLSDLSNPHRWKGDGVAVSFTRYVDGEGKPQ